MVDVSGQHTSELLVDEPVNDPSVHNSSSNDDDLRGEKQGDVEAQLGQVVPHQFPDPRVLGYIGQGSKVYLKSVCYGLITDHTLNASLFFVEGTHSSEVLKLLGMSFCSESAKIYMMCPP